MFIFPPKLVGTNYNCSAAQKIRQAIGKEIDKTKRQAPDNIDVSRLKGLEEIMAKYVFGRPNHTLFSLSLCVV